MHSIQLLTMFSALLVAVFLLNSVRGGLVEVEECDNGSPKPEKVSVLNCDVTPCDFIIGTTVEMNMTFMLENDHQTMYAKAIAKVMGANIPYPLPQSNACESLINNRCPLEAGEIVTYHLSMPIISAFPPLDSIEITFKMVENLWSTDSFVCFVIPARIVAP